MAFKSSLREQWKKFTVFMLGTPPVNAMDASDVRYIGEKLEDETGFGIMCRDSRIVNGRVNVGIIMPPDTPAEKIAQAESVFLAAAKERGLKLKAEEIVRYMPDAEFVPWRVVAPAPKTWK